MSGIRMIKIIMAHLYLFYVMISTIITVSVSVSVSAAVPVITVASIQAEGLACIALAKAIPGLQNIAGASPHEASISRSQLFVQA